MVTKNKKINFDETHWIHARWRPMMGWIYMIICISDFVLFPVLWSILQANIGGQVTEQWRPLTLQGAGLFHLAMGAIMGVAAWSRGQEKITAMNINSLVDSGQQTEYTQDTTTQKPANDPRFRFNPPKPSRPPKEEGMPPLD